MTKLLRPFILSTLLLLPAGAGAQVSFGVRIGEPPAPGAHRVPRQPGPGYDWVEGYYTVVRGRYIWHPGHWVRPPYPGAYWRAPYYLDGQFYRGQWEGDRRHRDDDRRN